MVLNLASAACFQRFELLGGEAGGAWGGGGFFFLALFLGFGVFVVLVVVARTARRPMAR